jgi:hypothetical protein
MAGNDDRDRVAAAGAADRARVGAELRAHLAVGPSCGRRESPASIAQTWRCSSSPPSPAQVEHPQGAVRHRRELPARFGQQRSRRLVRRRGALVPAECGGSRCRRRRPPAVPNGVARQTFACRTVASGGRICQHDAQMDAC